MGSLRKAVGVCCFRMIGGANTRDVVNHTFGEALEATQSSYPKKFVQNDFVTPGSQGMTIEGTIVEMRHHTLIDSEKTYHRYLALVIEVRRGNNRTFSDNGQEIETEQSRVIRSRVGFSSWKEEVKADPNELTLEFIAARFGGRGMHPGLFDENQNL